MQVRPTDADEQGLHLALVLLAFQEAGNITDYEPGTKFIVRQRKKGRK